MTNALTNYAETKLVDHLFRSDTFAPPATLYLALFAADPGETGSLASEVSGNNYARASVSAADVQWAATQVDGNGYTTTTNVNAVTFPTPSGAWGTVTHWGVADAASAGNLLAYGALTNQKIIGPNDPAPSFLAGAFSCGFKSDSASLDNEIINHLFRTTKISKPTTHYAALLTGSGPWTEVSAGGYARASVAVGDAFFTATSGGNGQTTNVSAIQFGAPTADWGAITAVRLYDAATNGNILAHANCVAKNVNNGDTAPSIPAGSLTFTLA